MATRRCLRPKQRISYFEPDEPDLDEYVYCESCMDYVYEYCSIHGALLVIPDDKVPAKHNFPSFVPRAALTIPRVFLHLNYSSIPGAGLGVFATLTLPKGVRFGPYRGVKTKQVDDTDYSWQLYDGLRRPSHVVDAADGDASNWMRFVNCARHWREQNLVAFQYRGELYYRTIKVVPRHTELLVFYGSQFANKLHIDLGRYNAPPTYAHKFGAPVTKKRKTEEGKSTQNKDVVITVENNTKNKKKKQSKTESTKKNYGEFNKKVKVNNIDVSQKTNKTTVIEIVVSKQNVVDNVIANIPSQNNSLCLKGEKIQKSIPLSDVYFTCNECNYKAITKEILIKHLRYHDSNRQHVCDICGYRYFTNMNLNQHKLCHTTNETSMTIPNIICNVKLYSCSKCDYKSLQAGNLKRHLRTHTGEKPYSCNKCDYKCSVASSLKTHLRTHTGEKPYSCNKCDYKCSEAGSLKTHLRTHTGEKPYSCNKCDYKSSHAVSLKRHLRTHTGEKPYSCNKCDYKSSQAGSLKIHLRTHTGEKPYSCNKCDYKSSEAGHLKRHLRTHTGEKPYSCNKCDYKSSEAGHLKTHLRTHTGEKPYSCNKCDYKSSQAGNLKTHLMTHTGEKPYSCNKCDYKSLQAGNLKTHLRIHTRENPS